MHFVLHCGFPKTGTTALQSWCASNEALLFAGGIHYPKAERDEEGFGHHLLADAAKGGPETLAARIAEACRGVESRSAFFSTESLSNHLNREDEGDADFFVSLAEIFRAKGSELHLIFSVRHLPDYLRSITLQNIIAGGEARRPSDFAAHTIHALRLCYESILRLARRHEQTHVFQYSRGLNTEIVEFVHMVAGSAPPLALQIPLAGASPPPESWMVFMWMNQTQTPVPNYLKRFLITDTGAAERLREFGRSRKLLEQFAEKDSVWQPSTDLAHAALRYFDAAWRESLCHSLAPAQNRAEEQLRQRMRYDIRCLVPESVIRLDAMHDFVSDPGNQSALATLFDQLKNDAKKLRA